MDIPDAKSLIGKSITDSTDELTKLFIDKLTLQLAKDIRIAHINKCNTVYVLLDKLSVVYLPVYNDSIIKHLQNLNYEAFIRSKYRRTHSKRLIHEHVLVITW